MILKISKLFILMSIIFLPGLSGAFTIEDAVSLALANNPNMQKNQMDQAISENDFIEKKTQNYGRVDLVASYNHYNLPRTLVPLSPVAIMADPTAVSTTEDLFVAGIRYEIPIFTGFAQKSSIGIAALQKEITRSLTKLNREELIYNVKTLYINILVLQAQKNAQSTYVDALQGLYNVIEREVSFGKRARVEQLKAAAELENAKAQNSRVSGNIIIVEAALAALLNVDVIPTPENITINIEVPEEADFQSKIKKLERYRTKELTVEINDQLIRKSNSDYFPQISMNAFLGQNFGANDSSNQNSGDWNSEEVWQVGVNLKWNIFDFGNTRSKSIKAKIRKQQSILDKLNTELETRKALIKAGTEINIAIDTHHSAKAELTLTREMELIEQIRFDNGAININDLLYARARNQQSLSRFINSEYNYINAIYYLDYLLENGEKK